VYAPIHFALVHNGAAARASVAGVDVQWRCRVLCPRAKQIGGSVQPAAKATRAIQSLFKQQHARAGQGGGGGQTKHHPYLQWGSVRDHMYHWPLYWTTLLSRYLCGPWTRVLTLFHDTGKNPGLSSALRVCMGSGGIHHQHLIGCMAPSPATMDYPCCPIGPNTVRHGAWLNAYV
jgi:hypothetical protein